MANDAKKLAIGITNLCTGCAVATFVAFVVFSIVLWLLLFKQ